MITKITARHMDVTDAMRQYAEKKIAKLSRFHSKLSEIELIVDNEGQINKVEIIVKADHRQPFVVTEINEDAYACVDGAVNKIERQLRKHKERSRIKKGRTGAAEATADIIEAQAEDSENQ